MAIEGSSALFRHYLIGCVLWEGAVREDFLVNTLIIKFRVPRVSVFKKISNINVRTRNSQSEILRGKQMEGMNQSLYTAIQGENEVNIFMSKWERNGEGNKV